MEWSGRVVDGWKGRLGGGWVVGGFGELGYWFQWASGLDARIGGSN